MLAPTLVRTPMIYTFFNKGRYGRLSYWVQASISAIVAFLATMMLAPSASAALASSCRVAPSASCVPPDDTGDGPGTLLATQLDPFSFVTSSGITHGAIKAEVFREVGGTLDFYYIVFNAPDSVTSVMQETDLNFSGWATSVAFRSDGSNIPGFVNGNIAPSSVFRDPSGSTIQFDFSGVPQNERSRVVVISTNAFYYAPGTTMIDGSGPLATFQPAVPEPESLFLLGSGLLLVIALGRQICKPPSAR
jgi:uncharacterized membrane protein YhaH (DUF805 family)